MNKKIILSLALILIALIIFSAGIFVGYHKASFGRDWDNSYRQGPGNPNSPFAPFMRNDDNMNPHGAIGQIVSIKLPLMMIKGPNTAEQIVIIGSSTTLRMMRGTASTSDIKVGDFVTAIGEPNDRGEIQASFIRIIPPAMK